MLLLGWGAPAAAQTFTVSSIGAANYGSIAAGSSGQSIFRAAASNGAVTKISGGGGRVATTTVRALVTIACGNQSACGNSQARITVATTGTPTGRAGALQNFTVSTSGASATITDAPGTGSSIDFRIGPVGRNSSKTFWLGFDLPIKGDNMGGATGNATARFVVTVSKTNGQGSNARTGTVAASVFRALAISNTTALAFGRISLPFTGTGTVSLAPATGAVTVTGAGVKALSAQSSSAARFNITGEGGQSVSISVSATFALSRGPRSITVTAIPNASGAQVLSGALGALGTRTLLVGGSFGLSSSITPGNYTGTLSATVQYN